MAAPATSRRTTASGTADPLGSSTTPVIGDAGWASPAARNRDRRKAGIDVEPPGFPYNIRTDRVRFRTKFHEDQHEGHESTRRRGGVHRTVAGRGGRAGASRPASAAGRRMAAAARDGA